MSFDPQPFLAGQAVLHWLFVVLGSLAVAAFVGFVVSLIAAGKQGPRLFAQSVGRAIVDLTRLSPRRIGAVAGLTARESHRRKIVAVFYVFLILFAFAAWFLSGSAAQDAAAKPYVSFVLTAVRWILIVVTIILACWGLPADIKDRSLHTVVTKPVRRSEIVIGRMFGYGAVVTALLVVMSVIGYVWIYRLVPERAQQRGDLVSRQPVYGTLSWLDANGAPAESGINTGDIWFFRSYIEGNSNARAIYTFSDIDTDRLKAQNDGGLRLEYNFEAFRSHKGNIDEGIHFRLELRNPDNDKTALFPPHGDLQIREFSEASRYGSQASIIEIPATLSTDAGEVNLISDLISNGKLIVEVSCQDSEQYLGAARTDLFIRMPDRGFAVGYFKAIAGDWLLLAVIICIGTTASCFLKGPVSTLLTAGLLLMGGSARSFLIEQLDQLHGEEGQVLGGGAFESLYRIVTQMNQMSPLPETTGTDVIKWLDGIVYNLLEIVLNIIPNLDHFNMKPFVANGFDVPGSQVLAALSTAIGFFIPCVLLGYFSLQLRELEAK